MLPRHTLAGADSLDASVHTSRRGLGGALIIYNMLGAPVQRAAAAHLLRVLRHFYPFNVAAPDRVLGTPPGLAGPQKRKRRRKQASC